jgi:hexosaminidase
LELHFLKRACDVVASYGAAPACWDDCLLFDLDDDNWPARPTAYVWNNVWGWGREDAAYRLANAGFDVVLANATHLYFDLAYEKDPREPGSYWASFVDNRAPFEFNPLDVFQNAHTNSMGQPLTAAQFAKSVRLTAAGRKRIRGIQGGLWGENLRSPAAVEYMAFPRTIALAERAWAVEPDFAKLPDRKSREIAVSTAWNQFANALGQRELPRLSELAGEVRYRVPPPGAIVRDGKLHANVAFPGLTIHYTTDGRVPTIASPLYDDPLPAHPGYQLRAFDARGHASRSIALDPPDAK